MGICANIICEKIHKERAFLRIFSQINEKRLFLILKMIKKWHKTNYLTFLIEVKMGT